MRLKCAKIIDWSASKKSSPYAYAFVAVLVATLVLAFWPDYNRRWDRRVWTVKRHVKDVRKTVEAFHELKGRYPRSFDELRHIGRLDRLYGDLTSEKQSDVPVYQELNDKGGYYYDPNNGEIRLNLTRPVKEYLPRRYRGEAKDEIPSSW